MVTPEQIPDEVAEALARSMSWQSSIVSARDRLRMKGHIAVALAAWSGARVGEPVPTFEQPGRLILPLPPEGDA